MRIPEAVVKKLISTMYTLHCTKKLLDRLKVTVAQSSSPPTTALGNWYATALFWQPQVALLVNERTLTPVLMPLAPSSTLTERLASALSRVLTMHGATEEFIENELGEMAEVNIAKTANRRVVGTMNEFAFLADTYREDMGSVDLPALSMRLSETPCGAIGHQSPDRLLKEVIASSRHLS